MPESNTLSNEEAAVVFRRIGDLLEILGESRFTVQAYRRAADNIMQMEPDLRDVWHEGKLRDIPGVGEAIAKKIDELLSTGQLAYLQRLYLQVPESILELVEIPEIGPKRAKAIWDTLAVTTMAEVKQAAEQGRLRSVPGFGSKSEEKVLAGIRALESRSHRLPVGTARPLALELLRTLERTAGSARPTRVTLAGSLRRGTDMVSDINLLIAGDLPGLMSAVLQLRAVAGVAETQGDRAIVHLNRAWTASFGVPANVEVRATLQATSPEHWGSAIIAATGSKAHLSQLQVVAQQAGYEASFDGLRSLADSTRKRFAGEGDFYGFLGMACIPPELREGGGEIELARAGRLPDLISGPALCGELHAHTVWSDGGATVAEMAAAARARGYRYFLISDHSQSLGVTNGLTVERLQAQRAEIEAVNAQYDDFRLLHGVELEILSDGRLDLPDEILAWLDIVVASVHTGQRQAADLITQRALNALQNPHVDILAHPTGRILGRRPPNAVNLEAIIAASVRYGKALEINAHPSRLDLSDVNARQAAAAGVPIVISCDAHSPADLQLLPYGIEMARRAGLTAPQVLNTKSLAELLAWSSSHPD